jgi:hypothetical protein
MTDEIEAINRVWTYTIMIKADTPEAAMGSAVLALPRRAWTGRQSAKWAAEEEWAAMVKAGLRPGIPERSKLQWRCNFPDSDTQYACPEEWVYAMVYPVAVVAQTNQGMEEGRTDGEAQSQAGR